MFDIGTAILVLTGIVILLLAWNIRLDHNNTRLEDIIENLTDSVVSHQNSSAFWCAMYQLAIDVNNDMAEGLQQYRVTFGELLEDGTPAPVAPVLSTDDAIAAMQYCLACRTYRHPNHFAIYPMHASGLPPA
jgi:hypothetical protein